MYNAPRSLLATVSKITPGRRAPTITSLDEDGWVAISVMIERSQLANKMDELAEVGAIDILVTKIENSRATDDYLVQ